MNKQRIIQFLAFLAILLIGCKKEDDVIGCKKEDDVSKPTWLKIGEVIPSVLITDIVPDTIVKPPWNRETNYTIDLDGDEIADINFRVYENYIGGGLVLEKGGVKIRTLNSETFIRSDSIFACAFSNGDTIKIDDIWRSDELTLESHGNSNPSYPPGNSYGRGYWVDQDNKYLGIRKNDFLGWIKLDTHRTSFTLYEYALQK